MQPPPEPEISNYRGPGQRALDLLKSAAIHAVGLLVSAILGWGILAVTSPFGPWANRRSPMAKIMAAKTQMHSFQQALLAYTRDYGQPPTTAQGLAALVVPPIPPRPHPWQRYMDVPEVPKDPWGNDFEYTSPGPRGERWVIQNFGRDGVPGGKGDAADMVFDYLDAVRDERSRR